MAELMTVPDDLSRRTDVSTDELFAMWETAGLYYAYGRFDAGEEIIFDEQIEAFATAYAAQCANHGYTPVRQFYDAYVQVWRR